MAKKVLTPEQAEIKAMKKKKRGENWTKFFAVLLALALTLGIVFIGKNQAEKALGAAETETQADNGSDNGSSDDAFSDDAFDNGGTADDGSAATDNTADTPATDDGSSSSSDSSSSSSSSDSSSSSSSSSADSSSSSSSSTPAATDAASVANLINKVTGEAVAAKAGYNWKRVCEVNNVNVGNSTTTSIVNSFINGIAEGNDLNSVVGGFLGNGTKSATVPKGQTLETIKVKNDDGEMENVYHAKDYTLQKTNLTANDIGNISVNGNTYTFSVRDSSYEGDNAPNTSLWKVTHDMVLMSNVDQEIKGFTSSAGVNSLQANYKNIKVTAVIANGKLTSFMYQFTADAKLGVKLGISVTGTGDLRAQAQYSNISY